MEYILIFFKTVAQLLTPAKGSKAKVGYHGIFKNPPHPPCQDLQAAVPSSAIRTPGPHRHHNISSLTGRAVADPCPHLPAGSTLPCCLEFHDFGKNKDPQHHTSFFYFSLLLLGAILALLQPALVFLPS